MSKLQLKLVDVARALKDVPELPNKHFSFLVKKNRIVCVGWNRPKTHPLLAKFGYEDHSTLHSEMDVLTRYSGDLSKVALWNVRVNRRGDLRMSRPCVYCIPVIAHFGIKEIWYTDQDGNFKGVRP